MAIEWNIPYLGITFGDFHLLSIKKQLANMVFQRFLQVKSPLHNAALASLMQGPSTTVPAKPIEDETAIPKKRAKVGPRGVSAVDALQSSQAHERAQVHDPRPQKV